jgi:CubicO group peptidase (beta-lactamase class C family)
MTAFLCAELVERGLLRWDMRIGELLPHIMEEALPIYEEVNVKDLLSHRAGILPFTDLLAFDTLPQLDGQGKVDRRRSFTWWLVQQPSAHVGAFDYSNGGYTVASAMIEKASGFGWERLMKRYVFNPIQVDGGFGWPMDRKNDQVIGHYIPEGAAQLRPHGPELDFQVHPFISAAGDVHLSVLDFGKYLQGYLKGWQGRSELLSKESFQMLLDGRKDYAMGWKNEKIDEHAINHHAGTTGLFYSYAVILRDLDIAFVIMANAADESTKAGVKELKELLIKRCIEKKKP